MWDTLYFDIKSLRLKYDREKVQETNKSGEKTEA